MSDRRDWSVVVFAARESAATVRTTLDALHRAAPWPSLKIDVIVNGNAELAAAVVNLLDRERDKAVRLWSIEFGDKANAWTRYLHDVWNGEELVFFVDGYVRVQPDALRSLGDTVMADPQALGGTGVPSIGRTAAKVAAEMLRTGGFQGNLCCVKGTAVAELRRRNIGLPIGLYRVDSLVASLLHFAFDPAREAWVPSRVRVDGAATWVVDEKSWLRPADLKAKFKRSVRQAKGLIENAAVHEHMVTLRKSPETLARSARELVLWWCEAKPRELRRLVWRNPLVLLGLRELAVVDSACEQDLQARLQWSCE